MNNKTVFFSLLMGVLIGVVSIMFYDFAQYFMVFIASVLLACLLIKSSPFYIIIFFICWLPVQNIILMCLSGFGGVPDGIIRGVLSSKEIIASMLLLYLILSGRIRNKRLRLVDYVIFAYFLWTTIYLFIPNSLFPVSTGIMGRSMSYRAAVVPGVLYFIGRFIPFNRNKLMFSIRIIIFVAVCVSIFGIIERFFIPDSFWINAQISYFSMLKGNPILSALPDNFFGIYGGQYLRRAVSTYCDPLIFGFVNIFVVPLTLYFIITKKTGILQNLLKRFGVFSFIIFAQLLTLTRAAILGNLLSMGTFILYIKMSRIKMIFIFLTILMILLWNPISQRISHQTMNLSDPSSKSHISALNTGLNNVIAHPFGYGLGQGGYVGSVFGLGLAGESLYFTIAVERGIIGIFLFTLSIIILIVFCFKNLKYVKDDLFLLGLVYTIIAATAGYALASLTTEHWQAFVSAGIYWLYTGITVQAINKYRTTGVY